MIPIAEKLASRICFLVASDRVQAQALLAIYSRSYSAPSQWIIKVGTLTALLAAELGYLETIALRLVKAAITMDITILDVIGARFQAQPISAEMKQRWRKHPALSFTLLRDAGVKDSFWLSHVLQHQERRNGSGYPSRLHGARILPTASLLSLVTDTLDLLMPTVARQGIPIDTVVARLYKQRLHHKRSHLNALVSVFSPVPAGAQLKLVSGGLALILRKPVKEYVWAVQPISRATQTTPEVIKLERPDVERVFPMLRFDKVDLMQTWIDGHAQMSNVFDTSWPEPMPKPSPLKVKLSQQLSVEHPNITRIAEYIASEPSLCNTLSDMANRQVKGAKPTREAKHAIMMIGLERLGPMLIRSDLLQQVQLRRFPLDFWAYQYIEIFSEAAAQIAVQSYFLMPEQARTLAVFAVCGWLFDKELQHRIQLKDRQQNELELNSIFELLTTTNARELAQHGLRLAELWKMPSNLLDALEAFAFVKAPEAISLKGRHPFYLLQLAGHLTIEILGKENNWHERTALLTRLDISTEKYAEAKQEVMACGCVISPLP